VDGAGASLALALGRAQASIWESSKASSFADSSPEDGKASGFRLPAECTAGKNMMLRRLPGPILLDRGSLLAS